MKIFDNVRNPLVLLMSLIFCVTSSGCDTSYDSMVEEYNGCYEVKTTTKTIPTVGTNGFDSNTMIRDEYMVDRNVGVVIVAPDGGDSYEWTALDTEETLGTKRVLDYLPTELYESGIRYEVILTIKFLDSSRRIHTCSKSTYFVFYE